MEKNVRLAAVLVALMMSVTMFAKKDDFGGRVVDTKGEPLPFVNVVLLSLPDSAFVQGAITDEQGRFKMDIKDEKDKRSSGLLKVSSIGYVTQALPFIGGRGEGLLITLQEDAKLLGEVVVKAQLPKVKLTGEGLQTNIRGSVLENAGTAVDVLEKTPGMIKGQNGLEVIGRGAPLVYINGHKVTDSSELARLQSNEIQSIEVITNPGAQYDATVHSVVRIRTIRRQGDGFSLNTYASDAQSLRWNKGNDATGALNVNYRTGGVDIFAGVNYSRNTSRQESELEKQTFGTDFLFDDKGSLVAEFIGQSIYGNAGVNWQISDNHFVGGKLEWGRQLQTDVRTVVNDNVLENGVQVDKLATISEDEIGDKTPYNLGANIYYNGTIGGKLGMDVNLDYYGTESSTSSTSKENSTMTHDADISSDSRNDAQLYAGKAVLSYPVWKGQLQAGTEETFTRRSDVYSISGINIPASKAEVSEDTYAAFASYAFMLPKVGQFNVGARYERVHYAYNDAIAPANDLKRNYGNIFPTVSYAGQFGRVQLMLNYSAKTQRPNYANLSSAIRYNSRYIWQSGNAQLQPELSHNIGLTAVWKFITFSVNYTRTNHAMMVWSSPYGTDGVVLVQPRNIDTPYRSMAAYVNFMPTIGPWTMNYTIGIQPQWLTINAADPREPSGFRETRFNGRPIGFAQLNNTFTVKNNWQFELGAHVMTKGYTQNLRMTNLYCDINAAVQKKLLKDGALVLRLEGKDLAGLAHYNVDSDFGSHTITQTNTMDMQKVKLSVSYNFNTAQSKYRGTGAGQDNKSRM